MSWTTPRTWVNGEVETAAIFNTHIRDNMSLLATVFNTSTGKINGVTSTYLLSRTSTLFVENYAAVGSSVGSGETDLCSYSLPAATLAANGDHVRMYAFGNTANTANTKRVRQYFGSTVLIDVTMAISTNYAWYSYSSIFRTGAATQRAFSRFLYGTTDTVLAFAGAGATSPAATLSGAVTVKTTGQGGTNGDISARQFIETFLT